MFLHGGQFNTSTKLEDIVYALEIKQIEGNV